MKIKLFLLSLLCSYNAMAQNMVSMTSIHPTADTVGASSQELAIRYPGLRQFNIVTNSYGYGNFDAKLNDQHFATGKIRTLRTCSFFNTPAAQWSRNSLSATIFYTYTSIELKDNINYLPEPLRPLTSDKSTIDLALNYSRSDSIFHHPILYSLIVNFISDNLSSVRRFNFNGSFSLPLIRKRNTSLYIGALLIIDPSSPVPLEPIINYYHKFPLSGIELIVDIPTGINLKKQIIRNAWVLVGSNQNSYSTFYNNHEGLLNGKASYNTIEVKSGLAFEYLLVKKLVVGLGGGINSTFSSRVFKNGEDFGTAAVTSKNKPVSYVNLSLSLLPF